MDTNDIKNLVEEQIAKATSFENFHGITKDNLSSFLVEPYSVSVDPDDREMEEREMWVVLNPPGDILLAFDPLQSSWSVIEPCTTNKFIQVVSGATLAEALDGM